MDKLTKREFQTIRDLIAANAKRYDDRLDALQVDLERYETTVTQLTQPNWTVIATVSSLMIGAIALFCWRHHRIT